MLISKIKQLQIGKNIEKLETTLFELRKKLKGSILKTLILILSTEHTHHARTRTQYDHEKMCAYVMPLGKSRNLRLDSIAH